MILDHANCHKSIAVQETDNTPALSSSIGLPSAQELMVYQTWAKNAADSQMYRNVGKESGIMMIMLAAREYGIGPAQALNGGLHIIEGKVELSARMMSALIRRAKHKMQIMESTNTTCTISGRRSDTNEMYTATYTIEDARQAGLIKATGAWKTVPSDMLYARTLSKLARRLFSDVIGIGYIEGEIIDSRPLSDSRSPTVEEDPPEIPNMMENLLHEFPLEDRPLMVNYIEQVYTHYQWSPEYTVQAMFQELEKTKQAFKKYKEKSNAKVIHTIEQVTADDSDSTSP